MGELIFSISAQQDPLKYRNSIFDRTVLFMSDHLSEKAINMPSDAVTTRATSVYLVETGFLVYCSRLTAKSS